MNILGLNSIQFYDLRDRINQVAELDLNLMNVPPKFGDIYVSAIHLAYNLELLSAFLISYFLVPLIFMQVEDPLSIFM